MLSVGSVGEGGGSTYCLIAVAIERVEVKAPCTDVSRVPLMARSTTRCGRFSFSQIACNILLREPYAKWLQIAKTRACVVSATFEKSYLTLLREWALEPMYWPGLVMLCSRQMLDGIRASNRKGFAATSASNILATFNAAASCTKDSMQSPTLKPTTSNTTS